MKPILIFLILLTPISATAQPFNYEIKGTIKNFTPGEKLYFMHFGKERNLDSVIITNGKFLFKGNTEISNEPDKNYYQSVARLFLSHDGSDINFNIVHIHKYQPRDMITIYLEPGITDVAITDSAYNAIIKPPEINSGHYTLDSIYSAFHKKQKQAYSNSLKLYTDVNKRFFYNNKQTDIFKDEQKKDQWQFIKTHPSSPVSLYILKHIEEDYLTYEQLAPYFEPLSNTLKNTAFGKSYSEKLTALKRVRLKAKAPDFTMNTPENKPVSLSTFRGKYVLIDFWASWCVPCRRENPNVLKAYQKFKDKDFVILGVSLDSKKENWVKAINDDHLDWIQLSDLKEWDNAVAKLYSVGAIPQNFLINPKGTIIGRNLFGTELINRLAQIFGNSL